MGGSEGGGVDGQFEDSLGDFDEAIAGDASAGGGGGEGEIEILDPMGEGASGAQGDESVFEDGDAAEGGDSAEDQGIAQRAASGASGGSSSSSGGSSGGQGGGGGSSGQDSGSQQSQSGGSSAGGGGASAQQGDRTAGGTSSSGAEEGGSDIVPIPADVGDGRNDDIVLRQIREAAMNERDPVLREKLWDEYRRIRGSR
jgi:hypothetical protein